MFKKSYYKILEESILISGGEYYSYTKKRPENEYTIKEMKHYEEVIVESNIDFEYISLTKYEFIINNNKFEMTPYFD